MKSLNSFRKSVVLCMLFFMISDAWAQKSLGSLSIDAHPVFDKIDERGSLLLDATLPIKVALGNVGTLVPKLVLQTKPRHVEKSFLGANSWFPLLDCSVVSLAEDHIVVNTLTGGYLDLFPIVGESGAFATRDNQFVGRLEGNHFELIGNDGWRMLFDKGRVKSLSYFGRELLRWSFHEKQIVISNLEGKKITASLGDNGLVRSVSNFDGSHPLVIEYSEIPRLAAVEQHLIPIGNEPILKKVTLAGKDVLLMDHDVDPDVQSITTKLFMSGLQTSLVWNPGTGMLKKFGEHEYRVEKNSGSQTNKISKIGHDGSVLESYHFDFSSMTAFLINRSEVIKRTYVAMPGPVYGKMREMIVENTTPAGSVVKSTKIYYNTKGELVRKVEGDGSTETVSQYVNGVLTSIEEQGRKTTFDVDSSGNRIVNVSGFGTNTRYLILPNGTFRPE